VSVASEQSAVARIEREIASIEGKIGAKEKTEADLFKRANAAATSAARATSVGTAASYRRQAEGYQRQIETNKNDRSSLISDRLRKQEQLRQAKDRLRREEASERTRTDQKEKLEKQRAATAQKAVEERARRQQAADAKIRQQEAADRAALVAELAAFKERAPVVKGEVSGPEIEHDFFISHASEDKEDFVRALAEALRNGGFRVWYDEFSLRIGDSLRRSIEKGISGSRFGVVVLSPDFFRKDWPQVELDALFALDTADAPKILPIWHRVSKDEVRAASPILAGRLALKTADHSLEEIVDRLAERLVP